MANENDRMGFGVVKRPMPEDKGFVRRPMPEDKGFVRRPMPDQPPLPASPIKPASSASSAPTGGGGGALQSLIGRGAGVGTPDRSRNVAFEGGGSFNVVKMGQPKGIGKPANAAIAGMSKPAPKVDDDIYTQAINKLKGIIEAPERREWVTPQGRKVSSRIDRSDQISAARAMGDLALQRRGIGAKQETAAAGQKLEQERIRQSASGLIQRANENLSDVEIKKENAFTKQLDLNSPKDALGTKDPTVGLLRMALSGSPIHESYKASANRLKAEFDEFFPNWIADNQDLVEDLPEGQQKKLAQKVFETQIGVPKISSKGI